MTTKPACFLAGSLALLAAAGCSTPMTGISRTAPMRHLPSETAVEEAVRQIPEIRNVEFRLVNPGEVWSMSASDMSERPYELFRYHTDRVDGTIEVRQNRSGLTMLNIYRIWTDPQPTPQQVDETKAVMDKVYASLRQSLPGLLPDPSMREQQISAAPK